jgi:hypothetical protein
LPKRWRAPSRGQAFGDVALIVFLIAQCLDGVFAYVGVAMFGIGIEANPIIASAMTQLGPGIGLTGAKVLSGGLGICLRICEIHQAVALLSAFYLAVAVAPWTVILFL